jgi:hypothetical protein
VHLYTQCRRLSSPYQMVYRMNNPLNYV